MSDAFVAWKFSPRPQIAQQMRRQRPKRIMPVVEPRAGGVDGNAQLRVLIAPPLQFAPVARGEQDAVAIENISAPDLVRQRIQPRIALRPLYAVVLEYFGFARQIIPIARDLIICRKSEQRRRGRAQRPLQADDRLAERFVIPRSRPARSI